MRKAKCFLAILTIIIAVMDLGYLLISYACEVEASGQCYQEIQDGYNYALNGFDTPGRIYVVLSYVMFFFYGLPIVGYLPLAVIAIKKLRSIDQDLF